MSQCSTADYRFYGELHSTITRLFPRSPGKKYIYKKKMQAPKHSFAIGRIVDQNKVSSNSTFLH